MENVCAVQEEKKKQTNKHFPFKWENYTKTEQKHNQSTFYYNFSVMEKSNKTFFFLCFISIRCCFFFLFSNVCIELLVSRVGKMLFIKRNHKKKRLNIICYEITEWIKDNHHHHIFFLCESS
jgi:hypothetical protein